MQIFKTTSRLQGEGIMIPKSGFIALLAGSIFLLHSSLFAQDVTVVAPTTEAAQGLDLQAVAELFKDAENLEAFEKNLNDPEIGINNLDLDENGEVDFLRVVEHAQDDVRLIILQAALGEDDFQDVATIEVEKSGEDYNMQVRGNEVIYGVNYYVAPAPVHIRVWPIFGWLYHPYHRPYVSVYRYGHHPRWWRPWRPVHINVYHQRTVRIRTSATFTVTKTSRVKNVHKISYKPVSSTRVKKRTTVTRTRSGKIKQTGRVKRTTTAGGKKTTVTKAGKRTVNPKTGTSTTVKAGKKTVTNRRTGKKTTVKGVKKTKRTKGGKKTTTVKAKKTTRKKKNH